MNVFNLLYSIACIGSTVGKSKYFVVSTYFRFPFHVAKRTTDDDRVLFVVSIQYLATGARATRGVQQG